MLVLLPACSLAGAVAVVSEVTHSTGVEAGLTTEAVVTHLGGDTVQHHGSEAGFREDHLSWSQVSGAPQTAALLLSSLEQLSGVHVVHCVHCVQLTVFSLLCPLCSTVFTVFSSTNKVTDVPM